MNYDLFLPDSVRTALKNEPPGAWMPSLPDGCIRLSAGYPYPSLVPWPQIGKSAQRLVASEQDLPLQYLGSERMELLRAQIRQRILQRGIPAQPEHLLVTSGAAQAIDLVARTLLDETVPLLVEAPTYMEALEMFRNYTHQIHGIPVDEDGLQTEVLETWLMARRQSMLPMPRLLYTIPSFHNPTGVTLTLDRRKALLELAERFDFLIVEDDAYGELFFAEAPVPLKALDERGRVIHVGSLSKVVAPGLRIGWLVAPPQLVSACAWFKKDLDHPFAEAIAATYLDAVDFAERLARLRAAYRDRRDLMIGTLRDSMPRGVTWSEPDGGFFMWLHVTGIDTHQWLPRALQSGVAYVPGKHFFVQPDEGLEFLRLSYSYLEPDAMVEGIQRLSVVLREALDA